MTIDEMKNAIVNELRVELQGDPSLSEEMLSIKVDNAIREVIRVRRYPAYYTDIMIENDIVDYQSNIKNIALYDYNQIGIEGQSASNENGDNRTFVDRNSLFRGVLPLAK